MQILSNVILPLLLLASPFVLVFWYLNKKSAGNLFYNLAVGLALLSAFVLIWVNLAVGIIGASDNVANLLFVGVLLISLLAVFISRFKAKGLAKAMLVTAAVQVMVAVIAWMFDWGANGPVWPKDLLIATAIFTSLWLVSAALFWKGSNLNQNES